MPAGVRGAWDERLVALGIRGHDGLLVLWSKRDGEARDGRLVPRGKGAQGELLVPSKVEQFGVGVRCLGG